MKLLNSSKLPLIDGPTQLKALVLDWAGTTVDFGSLAPTRTLERVFAAKGVAVTDDEIRANMGWPKRAQIGSILENPRVHAEWTRTHGTAPTEKDADDLYENFIPAQTECLLEYSSVLPGIPEAVEAFRSRGLKIGTTTGYTREMMDVIVASAAKEGYSPDCTLTPGEAGSGRPHPYMIYENAVRLQVYPMAAIVKVGDTLADIHEGLNAGCWSVGVAATGNLIGLSQKEFTALASAERDMRLAKAREALARAGAHYVVDSVAELEPVLDEINAYLQAGAVKELVG
jgi:phosphonoacetaldehyde hydrolase